MCQDNEQLAHAKLTVHLHITGVRDDGYHLIDAEMVSLDLADRLIFSQGDGVEVSGPEAVGVPVGAENLVTKALVLGGRRARVLIDKHIPAGGGLGGASSDAAAALRWAGMTNPLKASQIGADVPFCLRGGRAHVRGIGELLEPLQPVERVFTLLLPPFGVNTAAVFRAFDELATEGLIAVSGPNHLVAAAIAVEPRLVGWRDKLRELTGAEPMLAGAGSTWFVEGEFPEPATEVLGKARWVVARTTTPTSVD